MIFLFFFVLPMALAGGAEYLCCRLPRHAWWRWLPAGVSALFFLAGLIYRRLEWGPGVPVETLLFFPGVPTAGLLCGCLGGWRVWKRLWTPRVK